MAGKEAFSYSNGKVSWGEKNVPCWDSEWKPQSDLSLGVITNSLEKAWKMDETVNSIYKVYLYATSLLNGLRGLQAKSV